MPCSISALLCAFCIFSENVRVSTIQNLPIIYGMIQHQLLTTFLVSATKFFNFPRLEKTVPKHMAISRNFSKSSLALRKIPFNHVLKTFCFWVSWTSRTQTIHSCSLLPTPDCMRRVCHGPYLNHVLPLMIIIYLSGIMVRNLYGILRHFRASRRHTRPEATRCSKTSCFSLLYESNTKFFKDLLGRHTAAKCSLPKKDEQNIVWRLFEVSARDKV